MIKSEDGKVEISVNDWELMETMAYHEVTANVAMLACVGCDLTYIFNELVNKYGLNKSLMLWSEAVSAYDKVIAKGDKEHDKN